MGILTKGAGDTVPGKDNPNKKSPYEGNGEKEKLSPSSEMEKRESIQLGTC